MVNTKVSSHGTDSASDEIEEAIRLLSREFINKGIIREDVIESHCKGSILINSDDGEMTAMLCGLVCFSCARLITAGKSQARDVSAERVCHLTACSTLLVCATPMRSVPCSVMPGVTSQARARAQPNKQKPNPSSGCQPKCLTHSLLHKCKQSVPGTVDGDDPWRDVSCLPVKKWAGLAGRSKPHFLQS